MKVLFTSLSHTAYPTEIKSSLAIPDKQITMTTFLVMRKLVLLFVLSLIVHSVDAQYYTSDSTSSEQFRTILNNQFRLLLTGTPGSTPSNFASLDLSESKKVTFAPYFSSKKTGNIIGGKVNAGISDGVSDLFTNSKLNTNVSLDVEYNFITFNNRFHSKSEVSLLYDEAEEFEKKRDAALEKMRLDTLAIVNGETLKKYRDDLKTEKKLLDSLRNKAALKVLDIETQLEKAKLSLSTTKNKDSLNRVIDSLAKVVTDLKKPLSTIQLKLDIVEAKIKKDTLNEVDWIADAKGDRLREFSKQFDPYKMENLTVRGFKFGWFSIAYQIRHDAFQLFDPADEFSERLKSTTYSSNQIRLKYSYYSWSSIGRPTWFISAGLTYNHKSNYQDLKTAEVTITSDKGANGLDSTETMSTAKKYNAYVGEYKTNIDEGILNIDFYYFLSENTFALHLYPNLRVTEGVGTTFNAGIGLLYPFMDSKKEKAIVNAEIYYYWVDLGKHTREGFELYKQSKIGLRFSFPINFKSTQI